MICILNDEPGDAVDGIKKLFYYVHFVLKQNEPKIQEDFKEIFVSTHKTVDKSGRFMLFFASQNAISLDLQLFLRNLRFVF